MSAPLRQISIIFIADLLKDNELVELIAMLQRRSRTQSRPGSAPAQCSLVPLKNTEEEQASRSNEDIRYIGEKPVDSFKFFPANDSLGDDQNSNASVLLSVASKSSENLVDSPKCNSEILIPPVTATSSGYSSSGGSPINMSEAAGSSDCTREADASGQNDTDVTENENIMEEERPALGFQTEKYRLSFYFFYCLTSSTIIILVT